MKSSLNPIYSRRKRFLPVYRELFAVLLKIPDNDVKDRVMDAINGVQVCSVCKNKSSSNMDTSTQTDDVPEPIVEYTIKSETPGSLNQKCLEKRRQKRKRNCPKVVKTAQHSNNIPALRQEKNCDTRQKSPEKVMQSYDSDDNAVSVFFEKYNIEPSIIEEPMLEEDSKAINYIKEQMKFEWETSHHYNNAGLLPIHEAITSNELSKLKRQLYVWKYRRQNLMQLLTEDNDNLIQLAVKENCVKIIIDELLKENIPLNDLDGDYNNIIHLAVSHLSKDDIQQQNQLLGTLESLLKRIDLKILIQKNDNGLTPLHIAVKENKYLMAEKILNVIDERLNIKNINHLNNPYANEKEFLLHYCRQCDNFDKHNLNELKQEILNSTDMKRGCTVLYFAMELRREHLVYLLMAHMCNPTVKNLAGVDAKSYYAEYGKNAGIAGTIEKLTKVLSSN